MEVREESSPAVLKLFGREPLAEDWRFVGRWAYGAAWLSQDRATARELIRFRLESTAEAATIAAMSAGPGEAGRYSLVSAIARLPEAIRGEGAYAGAVERAIDEAAEALVDDGKDLRDLTMEERVTYAPRFHLEGFEAAMHELGPDRHVLLREVASQLDDAVSTARGACLSLRALRLFLQSTLSMDSHETSTAFEAGVEDYGDPVVRLGIWLLGDLALNAQRATRYEKAWSVAARVCGDPLSKTLAGLTSGSMATSDVASALFRDPWTLVTALAMTTDPQHASALLDCAVQAQTERRQVAARELARWAAKAKRIDDLENQAGLAVLTAYEDREGFRDCPPVGSIDLFNAWYWSSLAAESARTLAEAADRSTRLEMERRRSKVRLARASLDAAREAHEAMLEAARRRLEERLRRDREALGIQDGASAHRGCLYGFGAGCSVMATYAFISVVMGMGGLMGKIAPIVVAVAAMPVAAAIVAQMALALRRAAATAEAQRRREVAENEFEREKAAAERQTSATLTEGRHLLEEAEANLTEFERLVATETRPAA